MGSRSALLEDSLPPVEIESFAVERVSRAQAARVVVEIRPPGYELIERLRHKYEITIGAYGDCEPRTQSNVEHRVGRRADDVIDLLRLDRPMYDPVEHEYRVPIKLHLPWSWPALPMWLAVGELSSTKSALRLSLRSRRRLRYPKRYFHAAHAALRDLEGHLTP
jgi:hypothetical protein